MSAATITDPDAQVDLFDGVAVIFRRWYLVLPVLLITAFIAYRVHDNAPVEYTQSSSIGVVTSSVKVTEPDPPVTNGNGNGNGNADEPTIENSNALVTSGGVTLIANLVLLSLQQDSIAAGIEQAAPGAGYTVDVLSRAQNYGQLPVLSLTAQASTPEAATAALAAVQAAATTATQTVQANAGVPDSEFATPYVLRADSGPRAVVPSRTRATASVVLVGVGVAVIVVLLFEAVAGRMRRRSRTRRSRQA